MLACISLPRRVLCRDPSAAMAWMTKAVGVTPLTVLGGPKGQLVAHAELKLGSSMSQQHPKP